MKREFKCCVLLIISLLFSPYSRCLAEDAATEANPSQNNNCENRSQIVGYETSVNCKHDLCKCTCIDGRNPSVRKNIEEIVKVLILNDSAAALDALTEAEYDLNKYIQATTDKILLQLSIYTRQIADNIESRLREKKILKAIENINSRLATTGNDMQDPVFTQLQSIENNTIKEINELKDKISTLSDNNKILTETITSSNKVQQQTMGTINNRLAMLENATASEQQGIHNLLNITDNIQTSVVKSTDELKALLNASASTYDTTKIRTLCGVKIPSSVKINPDIWKDKQIPVADDLDTFLATKTGCLYTALEYNRNFDLPKRTFDGSLFEWRLAARTHENFDMGISWPGAGYSFFVGQEMNSKTSLRQWNPVEVLEKQTPGLLSTDRYVPVYIRIKNGVLTAGSECEGSPYFTRNVVIKPGDEVNMLFKSWSANGAKYLYVCPDLTGTS